MGCDAGGVTIRRRVVVTVSALMLATQLGSPLAADEPTLEQLTEISAYLADNDVEALRAYLRLNPALLDGDTPLAALLREFMTRSENLANYLGFEPDLRDAVRAARADDDNADPADEPAELPPRARDEQEPQVGTAPVPRPGRTSPEPDDGDGTDLGTPGGNEDPDGPEPPGEAPEVAPAPGGGEAIY